MAAGSWLIVSHDAGGAEVVSAWASKRPGRDFRFLLEGPARDIFRKKIPGIEIGDRQSLLPAVSGFDLVLTGTSWDSDLELQAIAAALAGNVVCAAYLDHWGTYNERFGLGGRQILPTEIWVGDEYALRLVEAAFPRIKARLEPNEYFRDTVAEIDRISGNRTAHGKKKNILYVCEPISVALEKKYRDPGYYGYSEFDALDGYLSYMLASPDDVQEIKLRLHPSEPSGKYSAILEKYQDKLGLAESSGRTLAEDCAWADWIVGCQSMAMVIGLLAGKKVFSSIPRRGKASLLPHREITHLFKG